MPGLIKEVSKEKPTEFSDWLDKEQEKKKKHVRDDSEVCCLWDCGPYLKM